MSGSFFFFRWQYDDDDDDDDDDDSRVRPVIPYIDEVFIL
jgi:hypothetical protein